MVKEVEDLEKKLLYEVVLKITDKKIQIRNSTIDFMVLTKESGCDSIEVRVQDGDVWLTQKAIATLFDM